jgi:hypothetical protein
MSTHRMGINEGLTLIYAESNGPRAPRVDHRPAVKPAQVPGRTIWQVLGRRACSALIWRTTLKP